MRAAVIAGVRSSLRFLAHAPAAITLVCANIVAYIVLKMAGSYLMFRLALWPPRSMLFHVWQMISYAFVHVSLMHLLANMIGLLAFGPGVERRLGGWRFLGFYSLCVLGAAAFHLSIATVRGGNVSEIAGASGGLFGVVWMFFWLFRDHPALRSSPIKPWKFVAFIGVVELVLGMLHSKPYAAHWAHTGGMLTSCVLMLYLRIGPSEQDKHDLAER